MSHPRHNVRFYWKRYRKHHFTGKLPKPTPSPLQHLMPKRSPLRPPTTLRLPFAAYVLTHSLSPWYQPGVGISSAVNAGCKVLVRPNTALSVNESRAHQILGRYTCKLGCLDSNFFAFHCTSCSCCTCYRAIQFWIMNNEICEIEWVIISGLILSSTNIESEEPAEAAPFRRISIRCKVAQPQTNHARIWKEITKKWKLTKDESLRLGRFEAQ